MNWRRFLPTTRQVTDAATSKAAQAAAGAVVDRFGPHRALSKIGTVSILLGALVLPLAWLFLTGWAFWTATVCGVILIGFGYALRGFNSLVVSLLAKLLRSIGQRIYNFAKVRLKRLRDARAARQRKTDEPLR